MIRWFWKCLPDGVQLRIRAFPLVAAWRTAVSRRDWRGLEFNEIYDKKYFEFVEKTTGPAASIISESIWAACRPRYALDVGCGTGALLAALRDRGVRVVGLELAEAARAACERRGIDVRPFDASSDAPPAFDGVDLVISMEMGHSIPEDNRITMSICSALTGPRPSFFPRLALGAGIASP